VGRFAAERDAGETFATWLERAGGSEAVADGLRDLDVFPTYEERPDFYVDFDETGPFDGSVGVGECAAS
jgi:hypothetical protein